MPTYEIEQYEIHTQLFRVQAKSKAAAIKKLLAGQGEAVDNGLELIEVCNDRGLPVKTHRSLAAALQRTGIQPVNGLIPSIRQVEIVG